MSAYIVVHTANDNLACHVRIAQGGNSLGGEAALLRVLADVLAGEINKRVWDVWLSERYNRVTTDQGGVLGGCLLGAQPRAALGLTASLQLDRMLVVVLLDLCE